MRQKTLLLAPVMSKLDHVRPALHRLSKYEQKDVDVRLIPLLKHTQPRLEMFCEFMKNQESFGKLPGKHTVELFAQSGDDVLSNNWFSSWNILMQSLLSSNREIYGRNIEIIVLLSEHVPTGITLASSIATLTIPNVRLIEFPVGYDLNSQGDNFDPSRQIMEQMIEFDTWSGHGIREPLIQLTSKQEVLKVLDTIRDLAERNAILSKQNVSNNLTLEILNVFQIREILRDKELGEKKSNKTSSSLLSNRLKTLREVGVIEKIDGKAAYRITETGLIISGLLSKANQ